MEHQRIRSREMEVNTMAMLDASGFNKADQDLNDDRNAFLEAVRSASLVPDHGVAPTKKMFEAVFQILKDGNSLELIIASYQLLHELDEHFPRVYVSKVESSKLPSSSNVPELIVVEEAWSPFMFGSDSERHNANKNSGQSLDSAVFHTLIQDLAEVSVATKIEELDTKSLGIMLLFQYLVSVLERDFIPRYAMCKENMNWNLLRESLLNMLLGSRRINYKGLVKDCLSIMFEISGACNDIRHCSKLQENPAKEPSKCYDYAVAISFSEVQKHMCLAMQKLLLMAIELDSSKKKADVLGLTTRADGLRTPVVELIQDELSYNRDALSPFFQVFNEPEWKLEIIVQYLQKYISKPSVRTRQSSVPTDDATFDGILKCFLDTNRAKNITKKITSEVAQLLLAHAFQAYLSLSSQHLDGDVRDSSLVDICKDIISAFTNLKRIDKHMEILPFGKEALFTAATILSTKS
ncbi:negative regulator of systemic acquired resistance SNI1 isoform X1 [Diospyros lotus]|uniref:negative regulator of systemic acquired resistance SNI1 isoform X1 n=1 Tax=Diospyros lotus TaxID=55363 RepID=UPI00224D6306|nr:negative regulator of systemic acquired resistance SNI1 isoform X1 [Diospyros lotus]XP_052183659.1 negative regulator of systemic acquired resistance SNI1 isoform X1 [Diospyros lotus]XP_052183661.1 negative regulator of systemic acquired resistance SNI1 isoform X1 [Diospyros lotus]XP_052183662.1 negative regulator of systemic acquired resistance SNI1 isoform X1 [Diospyros lotus]XP_052183663.1 negative regulator of systemic acquired resistance SNI1 isoform X1 [Diospyros lotus]